MWPNPQFPADLFTFTEEIRNGKFHFLCSETFLVVIQCAEMCKCKSNMRRLCKSDFAFTILTFWYSFYYYYYYYFFIISCIHVTLWKLAKGLVIGRDPCKMRLDTFDSDINFLCKFEPGNQLIISKGGHAAAKVWKAVKLFDFKGWSCSSCNIIYLVPMIS